MHSRKHAKIRYRILSNALKITSADFYLQPKHIYMEIFNTYFFDENTCVCVWSTEPTATSIVRSVNRIFPGRWTSVQLFSALWLRRQLGLAFEQPPSTL